MKQIVYFVSIFFLLSASCGSSDKKTSRKISNPDFGIQTAKAAFDPASLKFACDSLKFTTEIKVGKIQKLIVMNGSYPIDTILIAPKKLMEGAENEIIKADYNFDGCCEFVIRDKNKAKNGIPKHYYFVYNPEKQSFDENTTLPAFIGEFKLDIKNQRVKLYCPGNECFAYYKYNQNKKFELVQGEFKSID